MNKLGKYSFGIGDRFAHQGEYQLQAFADAKKLGVEITPVWNKSNREHKTVASKPESVRKEANDAVAKLRWDGSYLVDADHITMETVEGFIASSDFFTIDVANKIQVKPSDDILVKFVENHASLIGPLQIEGFDEPLVVTGEVLTKVANTFYLAIEEAAAIYNKIKTTKNGAYFAVEVSMDEVAEPQSPLEMFFILMMLSEAGVPVDTIAPKFNGRFNKGVDYEGDIAAFTKEFEQDILVIKHAVKHFGLPEGLKLSVHTGSDKFSLYPIIGKLVSKHHVGLHLKTAGTTWLEELIGLADSGGTGLAMAKKIYREAMGRYDELTVPYETVLNIDKAKLPTADEVDAWEGAKLANALRHNQAHPDFNAHFRQVLHTAYKVAAEIGQPFLDELAKNREIIGKNVHENILERHIKPLFL